MAVPARFVSYSPVTLPSGSSPTSVQSSPSSFSFFRAHAPQEDPSSTSRGRDKKASWFARFLDATATLAVIGGSELPLESDDQRDESEILPSEGASVLADQRQLRALCEAAERALVSGQTPSPEERARLWGWHLRFLDSKTVSDAPAIPEEIEWIEETREADALLSLEVKRNIDKDVPRVGTSRVDPDSLRRVMWMLQSRSVPCRDSYSQSLSFIAAFALQAYEEVVEEESSGVARERRAFRVLDRLLRLSEIGRLFDPTASALVKLLNVFEETMTCVLGELAHAFARAGFAPVLYAQEWFSALFVTALAREACLLAWDWLLLASDPSNGLVWLGCAILHARRDALMRVGESFEGLAEGFKALVKSVTRAELADSLGEVRRLFAQTFATASPGLVVGFNAAHHRLLRGVQLDDEITTTSLLSLDHGFSSSLAYYAMTRACLLGNARVLRLLLASSQLAVGSDENLLLSPLGFNPLHASVLLDHAECVRVLVASTSSRRVAAWREERWSPMRGEGDAKGLTPSQLASWLNSLSPEDWQLTRSILEGNETISETRCGRCRRKPPASGGRVCDRCSATCCSGCAVRLGRTKVVCASCGYYGYQLPLPHTSIDPAVSRALSLLGHDCECETCVRVRVRTPVGASKLSAWCVRVAHEELRALLQRLSLRGETWEKDERVEVGEKLFRGDGPKGPLV